MSTGDLIENKIAEITKAASKSTWEDPTKSPVVMHTSCEGNHNNHFSRDRCNSKKCR